LKGYGIEINFGNSDGEVGSDFGRGRGARIGRVDDFPEGGAAHEIILVKEVVGVP